MKVKFSLCVLALGMCCLTGVRAQTSDPANLPETGVMISPAKAMDEMVSMFEHEVTGVAEAMPSEKYGFAPSSGAMPGAKFNGVRTFAQEVTHIASANFYFASVVSGTKPDADIKAIGAMTTKDDCLKALAASFAFVHKAVATITPANAFESIKGADGLHTRVEMAAFVSAHGFDHYGQMVEYLRMNGIVPPGSKQ